MTGIQMAFKYQQTVEFERGGKASLICRCSRFGAERVACFTSFRTSTWMTQSGRSVLMPWWAG